ncbi:MAG: fumarylacetoacetate hydrolase family protein [Bacteroidia bacterium]
MHLYRYSDQILLQADGHWYHVPHRSWDELINRSGLYQYLKDAYLEWQMVADIPTQTPLAPLGEQEVWASGVTYQRSKEARMEEAKEAGGGDFYDRVYDADRPEIFFKATPHRVVGPNGDLRIRQDSTWDVPEPELALFVCSAGTIEGYTVGNDMSSRSIEGENPLYLPQAKTYDACAGLGPCLYVPAEPIDPKSLITLRIMRSGALAFEESIELSRMKRRLPELVDYLYRECSFPHGCFLMTGTGIVPPDSFTLQAGDEVEIEIQHIGILKNTIVSKA